MLTDPRSRRGGGIKEAYLVTGLAAGLQPLSVVPAAVDLPVLVEVDQIHQQLAAGDALEALGVPAGPGTRPAGEHSHVSAADLPATLGKHTPTCTCTSFRLGGVFLCL